MKKVSVKSGMTGAEGATAQAKNQAEKADCFGEVIISGHYINYAPVRAYRGFFGDKKRGRSDVKRKKIFL